MTLYLPDKDRKTHRTNKIASEHCSNKHCQNCDNFLKVQFGSELTQRRVYIHQHKKDCIETTTNGHGSLGNVHSETTYPDWYGFFSEGFFLIAIFPENHDLFVFLRKMFCEYFSTWLFVCQYVSSCFRFLPYFALLSIYVDHLLSRDLLLSTSFAFFFWTAG